MRWPLLPILLVGYWLDFPPCNPQGGTYTQPRCIAIGSRDDGVDTWCARDSDDTADSPKISSNSIPLAPNVLINQGRLPLENRPVPRSAAHMRWQLEDTAMRGAGRDGYTTATPSESHASGAKCSLRSSKLSRHALYAEVAPHQIVVSGQDTLLQGHLLAVAG